MLPYMLKAALGTGYPVAGIPRRIVAYMLLMTTLKLGDPVEAFIQVIIHNFTGRSCRLQLEGFHCSAIRCVPLHATNTRYHRDAHVPHFAR
jgi:hypothetical protein